MRDACGMKDTLSGTAEFKADITLSGATLEEQMRSLKGNVEFDILDGQFGPFAKLENLIIAENIRESQFFQTALGGIISGLLTIDTTHFSELNGKISFDDGICYIEPITSLGDILSLHIFGEFDLLRNYADMKVRARMASLISNLLGPIGAINPANLISNAASLNIVTAKAFSIFCEMVPEEELEVLPSFANSYVDSAATKFQIVVRGDVAKPLTLVKSFKWLAGQTEYQNAIDYVNSLPEQLEGSTATTVEELLAEDVKGKLKADAVQMSHHGQNGVTKEVYDDMQNYLHFAPLHNPGAMSGIRACMELMPNIKNVGVFDTAFHSTMPSKAYMYAIPYELYEENGIRRYGAHGTSHRYIARKCEELFGDLKGKKIISCHIGSGSSICAIKDGKCIDTSMGYTPLAGLVMGTRSGDVDLGAISFLIEKENLI